MDKVYFNPTDPGSYGGAARLYASARRTDEATKMKDVKAFLEKTDTYTLHKPRRYKFKRNRYIIKGIDDLWQADLADMSSLRRYNDGYAYILVIVDSF